MWRHHFDNHQKAKPTFLKSVFEKLRFCDRLVWTVGLTVTMKLCYQIYLALYMDGRNTLQRVHRSGGGGGGERTPWKVGWGYAACFLKPLPCLWPKSATFPSLSMTRPNIWYPTYDLTINQNPASDLRYKNSLVQTNVSTVNIICDGLLLIFFSIMKKKCFLKQTNIKTRVQKSFPVYDHNGQNRLKLIPYLWPKRLKGHILWGRTYLYSSYKGIRSSTPSPPPRACVHQRAHGVLYFPCQFTFRFKTGSSGHMEVFRPAQRSNTRPAWSILRTLKLANFCFLPVRNSNHTQSLWCFTHNALHHVLKLINNSSIYKPIRIRQFGQVRVVWNPDETLDRGLSTIVWWNIKL